MIKPLQRPVNLSVLFFILALLMYSCDTNFFSEGFVIDKATGLPVDGVKISIKDLDSTITDSCGRYKFNKTIYGSNAGRLEILLTKEGYKTRHIVFSRSKKPAEKALIEMEKLWNPSDGFCIGKKAVSRMYFFNKYILSLFNVVTLLFLIWRKGIRYKILWILGILILNITIFISYADCSITGFRLFNGPIYLTHFWIYPYSVKIVIPMAGILFWVLFFKNSRYLLHAQIPE